MFRREQPPEPDASEIARDVGARLALAGEDASPAQVDMALKQVLDERGLSWEDTRTLSVVHDISDRLAGLGPIGPLLRDPDVTEVMVNSPSEVYVERRGRIVPSRARFESEADIWHLIERVVSPLGLRVDATSPWVDARLPDGSRFHAAVPPITVGGPVVTIRTFRATHFGLDELVEGGCLSDTDAVRLRRAVRERRNILVSGGTGTGKTTLLGVLARMVGSRQRIITIEDAAELRLGRRHVVALETRPPTVEGRGTVTMRDLVRCAMRMRPDRIIVGEVRGPEALDMLQALNSGHSGSMATVHANSASDALMRLETLALLAAPGLSVTAARRQVGSAIQMVVHLTRFADGRRGVQDICEVRSGAQGPVLRRTRTAP